MLKRYDSAQKRTAYGVWHRRSGQLPIVAWVAAHQPIAHVDPRNLRCNVRRCAAHHAHAGSHIDIRCVRVLRERHRQYDEHDGDWHSGASDRFGHRRLVSPIRVTLGTHG